MEQEQAQGETVITLTRRVTEKVRQAARTNGAKAADIVQSDEHREKLRAGQKRRREAERLAKESAPSVVKEPGKMGRPRTRPLVVSEAPAVPNGEKRRGRPAGTGKHQKAMATAAQGEAQQEEDRAV